MFFDLNGFLRWAMWPIGLLFLNLLSFDLKGVYVYVTKLL